jgi:FKBP-type peptidyl-prolyl cis-trans isomerase SlyD
MKVQIVTFHCVLKNKFGRILGTSINHDVLTRPQSPNDPLLGLAKGLEDIQKGEKRKIVVTADEAYGFYDLSKVRRVSIDDFGQAPKMGQSVLLDEDSEKYRVTEIKDGLVTLDANHPLAGQDLVFEVEALEARAATSEDLPPTENSPDRPLFH